MQDFEVVASKLEQKAAELLRAAIAPEVVRQKTVGASAAMIIDLLLAKGPLGSLEIKKALPHLQATTVGSTISGLIAKGMIVRLNGKVALVPEKPTSESGSPRTLREWILFYVVSSPGCTALELAKLIEPRYSGEAVSLEISAMVSECKLRKDGALGLYVGRA